MWHGETAGRDALEQNEPLMDLSDLLPQGSLPRPRTRWTPWFAGVAAFYSLIHIERELLPRALMELYRVLAPEGKLLVTFHAGEGEIHRNEWFGQPVAVHVTLFTSAEMTKAMDTAGFRIGEVLERDPYEFEYPSRRASITAFRPM